MEALVGRAVRKAFPGFGTYAGVVESYDADAGYFRVLYEDGDSEEVDADEMAEILVGPVMPEALQRTPRGGGRCFQRWDHSSLGGSVLVEMEVDAIGLSPGIWRKPLRHRSRCCHRSRTCHRHRRVWIWAASPSSMSFKCTLA